jgi:hypothetical protein
MCSGALGVAHPGTPVEHKRRATRVRSAAEDAMMDCSHTCSGSLSRGVAWTRVVAIFAVLALAAFGLSRCFKSRESRLWDFVADARAAALDLREEDFFKCLDPAVRYRRNGGLKEVQRDWNQWKSAGIGTAAVTRQEAHLDDTGADVEMTVVLTVGIRPVAEVHVRLRAEDEGGKWRVVRLDWD